MIIRLNTCEVQNNHDTLPFLTLGLERHGEVIIQEKNQFIIPLFLFSKGIKESIYYYSSSSEEDDEEDSEMSMISPISSSLSFSTILRTFFLRFSMSFLVEIPRIPFLTSFA